MPGEVDIVVVIHQPYVIRLVRVRIRGDEFDIVFVLQYEIVENLQREKGEVKRLLCDLRY
ncbi:MAG: hypothetical protein C0600_15745 [Ignavibacteria bacterium]|nr:MAG: hypothetical protein C0600_15745 [Ignavibacteria bacterium]